MPWKTAFSSSGWSNRPGICIANPVVLVGQQAAPGGRQSNRMARQNIRHRLTAHYGPNARLSTMIDSGTFTTLITYPLDKK